MKKNLTAIFILFFSTCTLLLGDPNPKRIDEASEDKVKLTGKDTLERELSFAESAVHFHRLVNYWNGSSSHNWSNSDNWSLDRLPLDTDDVIIPSGTPNDPWLYVEDGVCQSLIVESGANLRIDDEQLVVITDITIFGNLTMDDNLGILNVGDDITWESGSTADISANSAEIFVSGDWNFESGANVQMEEGYVEFNSSGTSWLKTKDDDCYFKHVRNYKTSGVLVHSNASSDTLNIHGNLYIYSNCELQSETDEYIVINGFINNMDGNIHLDNGTVIYNGGSSTSNFMPGDYFNDLKINSTGTISFDDAIDIRDDLTINSGVLNPNNNTIEIAGNWRNNVGDAAFIEGSGRVIFYQYGTEMCYCKDEHFNILEINKTSNLYIMHGADVTCNSYDWTSGGMTVGYSSGLDEASFTAFDLADDGIYGRYQVQTDGTVDLHQDADSFIDLNGTMHIVNGGVANIHGGSGDSWWTFDGDVDFTMNEGILDFKDHGIKIHTGGFSLTTDITGGIIRTSGGFIGDRIDFNPSGGTIELYGSSDADLSHGTGSNFHNVNINKIGTRSERGTEIRFDRNGNRISRDRANTVDVHTDLDINGDLLITEGIFNLNTHTVNVSHNVDIYGTLQMINSVDVLNIGDHIYWQAGSNSNLSHGQINLDNNWFFYNGTNAQLGSNNTVSIAGPGTQFIYCFDDDAEFNDVEINKLDWAAWIHSSSTDTMRVAGDMTITADDIFQVETSDLLIEGILEIEDTGAMYLEHVDGTMTNNSDFVLNGELNIDGGEVFVNGDFDVATTGSIIIDNGSLTIDNPDFFSYIDGNLTMTGGTFTSNRNISFTIGATSFISGGLIDANGFRAEYAGNFEPIGGTVKISNVVDHGYIMCTNGNHLYNFTVSGGDVGSGAAASGFTIHNDLLIESGELFILFDPVSVLNDVDIYGGLWIHLHDKVFNVGDELGDEIIWHSGSYSDIVYGTINVYGDWTFEDGTDAQLETSSTVNFVGGHDQFITCHDADAEFGNVNCNQTAMSIYMHASGTQPMIVAGDMTISSQSFYIQNQNLIVNGILDIDNGTMVLSDNSDLNIGSELNVNSSGTLNATCNINNGATISQISDFYDFNIESGGTISAENMIFEYMSLNGIHIKSEAIVDLAHSFVNCTFQNGEELGTLLRIDNDQTLTINNAAFPNNTWSGAHNVLKSLDTGEVTFTNATGDFAGPVFEDDSFGKIHWDGFAPDLEITNVDWSSTEPYLCDQIVCTVKVYNNGNASILPGDIFYIDLYFNPVTSPVPGDYGDQYAQIDSGLPVGDFIEHTFYIIHDIAETWNSYLLLDTDEIIDELDEENNLWGPDIVNWNGLPAVDDLTIQNTGGNVELNWSYPINVDYFNIYCSEEPYDFSTARVETTGTNNYLEAVPGAKHFYYVTAVKECTPSRVFGNNIRKKRILRVYDQ